VGESLLLAAIHRAIEPGNKRAFSAWAKQATLPEIAGFNPEKLDSQHLLIEVDIKATSMLKEVGV